MNIASKQISVRQSIIKDLSLAPYGYKKLEWVQQYMPVLNILREDFEKTLPLKNKTIACCLHLEAKTGYLLQTLQAAGADVIACASNPLSTQDDVVAALVNSGITVFAIHGESTEEYEHFMQLMLDCQPDAIIDDGADVVSTLHKDRPEQAKKIIGGCEETTTGIIRLKSMDDDQALLFPMMAVNDAYMKYLFDNRYGTGQSVWDGINRTTNLVAAGKEVVVVGYGWCGKGVSMRAKGLGARVIVTEIDPIKANEAIMDGFRVMPMAEAARRGDVFITVTGNVNVIRKEHMEVMKDNAIMANAGHFDVEINKEDLLAMSKNVVTVRENIEEYRFKDGRSVYLLGEGRLVNLACGMGHPVEIMDMSFAVQVGSLLYLKDCGKNLKPAVHPVPQEVDRQIAAMKLKALAKTIDVLTKKQEKYWLNR